MKKLKLTGQHLQEFKEINDLKEKITNIPQENKLKIALVRKYFNQEDAFFSVERALFHAAWALKYNLDITIISFKFSVLFLPQHSIILNRI